VTVSYYILELFDRYVPPFVKQYAQLGDAILGAAKNYADDVRQGMYPKPVVEYREIAPLLAVK
jgi:3-methyl-2-oxobutanoate hydroxymethyltransferase